ncbi:TPA: pathogenicity island protein [Staphylococcus aureus]|uniref:pathogenicity island protein n=1 Tax=Staphylococcus TaxID=1279 RepID=UPI000D19CB09|nr:MULTISPECIES: pathogenicity island protein [Staphylococcus]HDE4337184.1 pathogenicity island protein [Staphylococcus aureus]MCQ9300842.1 pathogenicity island protein [Staphylococcus hyicus]NJH99168.1 pathogenicity island protein [Staphylococcus hyicus]NJI30461.1 pathogenicity island protein [Staphylococcus hyicus]PTH13980.1 pathogenicity island protein [Staphylococcus agnetis]
MKKIKKELVNYIKDNAGTSFVEIEKIFEENNFDYKGNGAYTSAESSHIVYWYGWNRQAFNIVSELVNDDLIQMNRCEPIIYMVDGKGLSLPIANNKNIETDYWLPVVFNISKKEKTQ